MVSMWILVSAVLCAAVVNGHGPIKLGPIPVHGKYGELSKQTPLTEKDLKASSNARFRLEQLREFFATGLGGIPVLDPYKMRVLNTAYFEDKDISGVIQYTDFELDGLSHFKLVKLVVNLAQRRVDCVLDFPRLVANVDAEAFITVDESTQYIGGNLTVTANNVHTVAAYTFGPTNDKLKIVGFEFDSESPDVEYNLKNIRYKSDVVKSTGGNDASDMTKLIAHTFAKLAGNDIAVQVVGELNKILANYTEKQILALLVTDAAF